MENTETEPTASAENENKSNEDVQLESVVPESNSNHQNNEEPEKTTETETPKTTENDNTLESTLDWIANAEENESSNNKNEKEGLLENINSSFVDALCDEAEVEKNLTELEDKVKNMLEELEKTSNDASENLVVEMDMNDIHNLRDELDGLISPSQERQAEDVNEINGQANGEATADETEGNVEVNGDCNLSSDVENAERTLDEEGNESRTDVEMTEQHDNENSQSGEEHEQECDPTSLLELISSEPQEPDSENEEETAVNSNMSILETTLKNGRETQTPNIQSPNIPNSITESIPVIKSEKSDTDNCDNNSFEHNVSNDIDKKPNVNASGIIENTAPPEPNDTPRESNEMPPPSVQDLIVREFCLQQDTLCNLVSATIESSLNVDTAQKEHQETSLIQHLLLSEPGITSFKIIEEIFKDAIALSTSKYLFLYSKLHSKCLEINPAALTTSFDMKRRTKICENQEVNKKVQEMLKRVLNQSAIEEVNNILKKMDVINPNELLFLHMALPKGYKNIKDTLRVTTICCRPIVSQTIMWLRTHYDEYPGVLTCKPDVFKGYQSFCEKNQIKPCGIPDFGKIIKRIYPKIFHRRQVVRGKTQYFYCGLRRRYQLDTPKLPPVKSTPEDQELPYNSHGCCAVYVYMHNLKYRQLSMKDYLSSTSHEANPKKPRPPKDPEFYKKGDFVNGKSILVHDPLELLSLSMNDHSQAVVHQRPPVSRKDPKESRMHPPGSILATVTTTPAAAAVATPSPPAATTLLTPPFKEYKNKKPKSRSQGRILKHKFKQYRHPSIKNVMNKHNIVVSHELYKTNVNPVVRLNNKELHNWCAQNIERFIEQISNINIVKNCDSSKLKVKYNCCDKTLKVNQYYGEQLKDLKRELENLEITKYYGSNDYNVTYVYPQEQLPDLLQLADRYNKKTTLKKNLSVKPTKKKSSKVSDKINKSKICSIFSAIKSKHKTIEKLLEKVDNITLPEEILTRNIEPKVALDSSEVTDWYEQKLNALKYKLTNPQEPEEDNVSEEEPENNLCEVEIEVAVPEAVVVTAPPENDLLVPVETSNLNNERKRPLDDINGDEPPQQKKPLHLSDIINGSELEKTAVDDKECTELTCYFCSKVCQNERELQNHCDMHLRCRTCKRRLSNQKAMIDHLVKHCFMNNAKCAPNIILPRIDKVNIIVKKYPGAFDPNYVPEINLSPITQNAIARRQLVSCITRFPPAVLNFNSSHNIDQILPSVNANETIIRRSKAIHTYSKSQKSANGPRFAKSGVPEVSHYQITTNPFKNMNEVQNLQQTTSHLKSTISNNFNRIFLLSNNNSTPPQPDSSNVVYGLYLNNRTDQSSPICLNNFNRLGSDCALNTNPSCSISESTNFMQIVETPPTTSLAQPTYESTMIPDNNLQHFEHQDHSYFQQPVYPLNNEVPTINNGLINGVAPQQNMHQNPMYDMSFLNNINSETQTCVNSLASTVNKGESTNPPPQPPPPPSSSAVPGPFRIRVKDIRELS